MQIFKAAANILGVGYNSRFSNFPHRTQLDAQGNKSVNYILCGGFNSVFLSVTVSLSLIGYSLYTHSMSLALLFQGKIKRGHFVNLPWKTFPQDLTR